jgi:cellulose synthase/poly-beta-1,6-N-acetylglucosamine synthase-like glycosyltransferase
MWMRLVFWGSALSIAYVYAGYPLLLAIWARLRPKAVGRTSEDGAFEPTVSIVVAARNEAARLTARVDNLLALDYPADKRQVIVVSDGSTDDTMEVLARYDGIVRAVETAGLGKAAALNAGVACATGDIVVFADARQMFAPDAVRALVAPFADAAIGGVTGELLLDCEASDVAGRRHRADRRHASDRRQRAKSRSDRRCAADRRGRFVSTIADGVGAYWKYEKRLRRLESAVGSTLGATGAIYALRRSLYRPLPPDTILDDVLAPMRAVLAGYRVVFSDTAYAFDRAAGDADAEGRRKVRTLAGNVQILWQEPRLLMPIVNPVWVQYMSHKVGRLVVPYLMLLLFASSLALAGRHPVYALALAAQCALYALGGYGAWLDLSGRVPATVPAAGPPAAAATGGGPLMRSRAAKRMANA